MLKKKQRLLLDRWMGDSVRKNGMFALANAMLTRKIHSLCVLPTKFLLLSLKKIRLWTINKKKSSPQKGENDDHGQGATVSIILQKHDDHYRMHVTKLRSTFGDSCRQLMVAYVEGNLDNDNKTRLKHALLTTSMTAVTTKRRETMTKMGVRSQNWVVIRLEAV